MKTTKRNTKTTEPRQSFSILLAEAIPLLREKISGILGRTKDIWCVIQVNGTADLLRGAMVSQPDFILADFTMLNDHQNVTLLRNCTDSCKIIAMTDVVTGPYMESAQCLGLDGISEKSKIEEYIQKEIRILRQQMELRYGE